MKKLTAILLVQFILVGMNLASAQTAPSPKELETISSYSELEFEKYVLKKGYSLNTMFSTETTSLYQKDIPAENGIRDQLSRTFASGMYSPIVQFATTDKAYYLDIFTYVSGNGFVATKQDKLEIIDGMLTTRYFFENETYTYTLYTFTTADNIVFYNVQVFKNFGK